MKTACVVTVALSLEGTMKMRGHMSKETGAPDVQKNYRNVKTISVVRHAHPTVCCFHAPLHQLATTACTSYFCVCVCVCVLSSC